jgi:phospholipid/cholesterol/gamma-HCH transport system substrate-binding protein
VRNTATATNTRTRTSGGVVRRLRTAVALLAGTLALTACDADVYSLPLPGGADTGDDPISVTVEFADVLDLVPQSSVKVNDISVGMITDIELTGQTATVELELRGDTGLPANSIATIRQTSLLGEKFVSLAAPTDQEPVGTLEDDAEIPLDRTGANPDVEEVLGALSLLLNGGGLPQLRTIAQELNLALEGREETARSLLDQVDIFMGQLDANKGDIVDAIESIDRLARSVRTEQDSIDLALEELPDSLDSLDSQREDLITMLDALNRLSDVGVRVIDRSKADTVEALRQLQPVLTQLANSGDSLVDSLNVILTFPFVDEVVGRDPQVARRLQMGDFTNLSVRLDLDLTDLPELPGIPCAELDAIPDDLPIDEILDLPGLCQSAQDAIAKCANNPSFRTCSALPGELVDVVCESLNLSLPLLCGRSGGGGGGGGLPPLSDVLDDLGIGGLLGGLTGGGGGGGGGNGGGGSGGGGGGGGGGGSDQGGGGGLLGGLGSLLNRPGTSDVASSPTPVDAGGPTYGELMQMFDPGLTSLLTPGMVLR